MRVDEVWQPDLTKEAKHVLGSTDVLHPGVAYLLQEAGDTYLAGPLQGAQLPVHYDYQDIRRTPQETRTGRANVHLNFFFWFFVFLFGFFSFW